MTFEELNPSIFKFEKEGDFIEGKLLRVQENVGTHNSRLYSIESKDGIKNVWGSQILDERMALVKVDDIVRITYKGLSKNKSKGKNPAKIFKVELDKQAPIKS